MRGAIPGFAVAVLAVAVAVARGDPAGSDRLASVAEIARSAEVVAIGEAHDNPAHHSLQSLLLERMAGAGQRPVVAMEMLAEDQQATLDQALAETRPAAELADRLQWRARGWPDFAMYYPLFEAARRYRLPVLAADLNAEARRLISRHGLEALPAANRARVASQLPADAARETLLERQLETVHCGVLPAGARRAMAEEWHARNVTMARRIAALLTDGQQVVLIAGRAHLAADAVPGQLEALRPGTRLLVIDLVELPDATPLQNADLVIRTAAVPRADECAELRRNRRSGTDGPRGNLAP